MISPHSYTTMADFDKHDLTYNIDTPAESSRYTGNAAMSRQIREQQKTRTAAFDAFNKILKQHYTAIIKAVSNMSKRIGSDIPVTDTLGEFVRVFSDIDAPDRKDVHLAICGFRMDATSRHVKARFMSGLKASSAILAKLASGKGGQHAKAAQTAVQALITAIDHFNDKTLKSVTDIKVSLHRRGQREEKREECAACGAVGGGCGCGGALGGTISEAMNLDGASIVSWQDPTLGELYDWEGGLPSDYAHVVGGIGDFPIVQNVQRDLIYKYNIANIEDTLGRSAADLATYSEEYKSILGDEVGFMMDTIVERYNEEMKNADWKKPRGTGVGQMAADRISKGEDKEQIASMVEAYRYMKTYQKNAKEELLRAAEALDLYLLNFANAIATNPQDVRDLMKVLSDVDVVAKWFSDKSGDTLVNLLESWPCDYKNSKPVWAVLEGKQEFPEDGQTLVPKSGPTGHYYEWVEKTVKTEGLFPGNPNLGWTPNGGSSQVKGLFRKAEKAVQSMRALENIIATFSKVGDKFGQSQLKGSTFMSHKDIFKVLTDYLVASSIAIGYDSKNVVGMEYYSFMESMFGNSTTAKMFGIVLLLIAVALGTAVGANQRFEKGDVGLKTGVAGAISGLVGALIIAAEKYTTKNMKDDVQGVFRGGNPLAPYMELLTSLGNKTPEQIQGLAVPLVKVLGFVLPSLALLSGRKLIGVKTTWKEKPIGENMAEVLNSKPRGKAGEGDGEEDQFKFYRTTTYKEAWENTAMQGRLKLVSPFIMTAYVEKMRPGWFKSFLESVLRIPAEADEPPAANLGKGDAANLGNEPPAANLGKGDAANLGKADVDEGADLGEADGPPVATPKATPKATPADGDGDVGAFGGYEVDARKAVAQSDLHNKLSLAMRSVEYGQLVASKEKQCLSINGYNNDFSDTDPIFEMMIKAMTAKIFTVVGTHALFNRPGIPTHPITPLRMILGGGSDQVIPEAVELYMRLPLWAEWYREKLQFRRSSGNDAHIISMVPSFDGVWSEFVQIVFTDADYVSDGAYTESDVKRIIAAVNDIWRHFKPKFPDTAVREVQLAFVREVNRRYGFVKRSEINEYLDEQRASLANVGLSVDEMYPDEDRVDYDLLEDHGVLEDGVRGEAPSDRFRRVKASSPSYRTSSSRVALWDEVQQFRESMEHEMQQYASKMTGDGIDVFKFKNTIRATREKIKIAESQEEKFNIVRDAIQGVDKYSNLSVERLLMFNEAVVSPLAALNAIYQVLSKFTNFVHGTNLKNLRAAIGGLKSASDAKNVHFNSPWDGSMAKGIFGFGGEKEKNALCTLLYNYCGTKAPTVDKERLREMACSLNRYFDDSRPLEGQLNSGGSIKAKKCRDQKSWEEINKDAWCRWGFNRQKLMVDLINNMFALGCDANGLAEVRITASGVPVLSYAPLQELCMRMINQTKNVLDKFRHLLPAEIIAKYESGEEGSLLWLEDRLVAVLFNNRDRMGLAEVNESLAATWKELTQTYKFDGSNPREPKAGTPTVDSYDNAMAELVYWNYKDDRSGKPQTDKTKFPFTHFPLFRSGNFEASTPDEKNLEKEMGNHGGLTRLALEDEKNRIIRDYAMINAVAGNWADKLANLAGARGDASPAAAVLKGVPLRQILKAYAYYEARQKGQAEQRERAEAKREGRAERVADAQFDPNKYQLAIMFIGLAPWPSYLLGNKYFAGCVKAAAIMSRLIGRNAKSDEWVAVLKVIDAITDEHTKDLAAVREKIQKANFISNSAAKLMLIQNRLQFYLPDGAAADEWSGVYNKSILVTFNELIARYVVGMSEKTQLLKIHLPLIDAIANGNSSAEVMQGTGIKDVNYTELYMNKLDSGKAVTYDPPEGSIIMASLGRALRGLVSATNAKGGKKFLYENFLDIPAHMKESMRCNLPIFEKELGMLVTKADFIRQILSQGNVDVTRHVPTSFARKATKKEYAAEIAPEADIHGGMRMVQSESHQERINYLTSILSGVASDSQNALRCITSAQKELNDVPQYLELYDGSIRDFRDRNRTLPFMPLSSLSFLVNPEGKMRDPNAVDVNWLSPHFSVGTSQFKIMYATRLLLAKSSVEPQIEYMPGVKVITEKFNSVSDKLSHISASSINSLMCDTVMAYRFATDIIYHKRIMGGAIGATRADSKVEYKMPAALMPRQFGSSLEDVISLTESNDLRGSFAAVANHISPSDGIRGADRAGTRLMNIVDSNIVPIHVHSLVREVPLINIFNYSYTFDRMVQDVMLPSFRPEQSQSFVRDETMPAESASEMFAKMLIHPYAQRTDKEYFAYIARIAAGDDTLSGGRPKYQSDQLTNKALLGDMHPFSGDGEFAPASEVARHQGMLFAEDRNRGMFGKRKFIGKPNARSSEVSFIKPKRGYGAKSGIGKADMGSKKTVEDLARLGKVRGDTRLVRSLEWFVGIQRFTRMSMRNSLEFVDQPVVNGIRVLSAKVTEYRADEGFDARDF